MPPTNSSNTNTNKTRKHRHHHHYPKGSRAWYNHQSPPFALWVCGRDNLVDGDKLLRRFERGREPHARLVHRKVIPDYEHLDVIWAMDAEAQVFREVRDTLWRTAPAEARARCRVPRGCEDVVPWMDDRRGGGGRADGQGASEEDQETLVGGENGDEESGSGSSSSEELSSA